MSSGNPLVPNLPISQTLLCFITEIMSGLFKIELLTEGECE